MKRIASLVALALFAVAAPFPALGAPTRVGFTARLADSGTPVTGSHTLVVRLFDVSSGGAALWTETHAGVAVSSGIAHLVLGSVTTLDDGLFNGAALFVELTVDATTLSPRLEVLGVPYAVRASSAGTALHAVAADALGTLTQTDLSSPGTINSGANPVDWTKLKNVPAGLADGVDDTGGTVTSVTGTAPISVSNGTTTPVVSMPAATASVSGYLSSADFGTFAGKQSRVTGTCTAPNSVRAVNQNGSVICGAPALSCVNVTLPFTVASGMSAAGIATCAAGYMVTGGGANNNYVGAANLNLIDSYPTASNGWYIRIYNATGASQTGDFYARCCSLQ